MVKFIRLSRYGLYFYVHYISLNITFGGSFLVGRTMFLCRSVVFITTEPYLNSVFKFSFQFNPSQKLFFLFPAFLSKPLFGEHYHNQLKVILNTSKVKIKNFFLWVYIQFLSTTFVSHPGHFLQGQELQGSPFLFTGCSLESQQSGSVRSFISSVEEYFI